MPDDLSDADARTRATRDVVARQGQAQFRDALIDAYGGRCAITGCDAIYALEAAHIRPYHGEHTNVVTNGLLLRADIHTLFDLHLLAINPQTCNVVISDLLTGDHYKWLRGAQLRPPIKPEHKPNEAELAKRWAKFKENEHSGVPAAE